MSSSPTCSWRRHRLLAPLTLGWRPLCASRPCAGDHRGVIVGPQVLGWWSSDLPVSIVSLLGLAFLLFLAGWSSMSTGCVAGV